jgi:hypothetical protein
MAVYGRRFLALERGGGMGDRRPRGKARLRLAAASALLIAAASSALADPNCWTDATTSDCPSGGWHVLQFKNGCSGGEKTINVCVKWTSGTSNGLVARFFSFANGGAMAEFHPGLCENGGISYNWQYDGSVPNCPTQ